jgi:hypothetical protein
MTLVRTSVALPFVVHVVDATSNRDGFEHDCTRAMCTALRAANVPLTPSSPHLAMDMQALGEAFAIEETWSVLLFVSHGEREPDGTADYVRLGDHDATWFMLHGIDLRLTDKAAFLCVCDGDCDDARWTLVREQLGLFMVAPREKITDGEARAFFPRCFKSCTGCRATSRPSTRSTPWTFTPRRQTARWSCVLASASSRRKGALPLRWRRSLTGMASTSSMRAKQSNALSAYDDAQEGRDAGGQLHRGAGVLEQAESEQRHPVLRHVRQRPADGGEFSLRTVGLGAARSAPRAEQHQRGRRRRHGAGVEHEPRGRGGVLRRRPGHARADRDRPTVLDQINTWLTGG